MVQLSKRLLAVSNMVTSGHRLADVGTDHGYIPLYLMEHDRITNAIAMDVNQGPLDRAKENIRIYGMRGKIETRLSDGVAALQAGEADSVVIAGMGGGLVIKILGEGAEVLQSVSELILQPQSDIDRVRIYLQQQGYRIEEENMVLEDDKYYPMMRVCHGFMEPLTDIEALYGPCLLKEKNECLKGYLEKQENTFVQIRQRLLESGTAKAQERLQELEREMEQVQRAKERMR